MPEKSFSKNHNVKANSNGRSWFYRCYNMRETLWMEESFDGWLVGFFFFIFFKRYPTIHLRSCFLFNFWSFNSYRRSSYTKHLYFSPHTAHTKYMEGFLIMTCTQQLSLCFMVIYMFLNSPLNLCTHVSNKFPHPWILLSIMEKENDFQLCLTIKCSLKRIFRHSDIIQHFESVCVFCTSVRYTLIMYQ